MKHIEINLGKVCNNRCRFCMSGNLAYFVDYDKAKREVIESANENYNSLGFLGGEVTLYPRLVDLIKLAKELGFEKIHIISNGRKYADENFLKKLIEAGANRFSVSIHSHLSRVEDYLTQIEGGFREKIKGLNNLINLHKKYNLINNISINLVINSKNYKDILYTLMYFNKLGINDFRLNYMWPEGNANIFYKDLLITYSEFFIYIERIIFLSNKLNFHIVFEGIPLCIFPNQKGIKSYMGELLDINTDVVTFEESGKLSFNWQKRKKNELKIKQHSCQSCKYDKICEGVWLRYIEICGWNEFKPVR